MRLQAATAAVITLALAGCGHSRKSVKAITYTRFLAGGGQEIWIAEPDGSHKRRLAQGGSPQISPDGRWVAFEGNCNSGFCQKLLIVPSGGGKPRRLADNVLASLWSPDGRHLLAYSPVNEEVGRLSVVDRDGGKKVELARGNLVGWTFSPDGDHVAYGLDVRGKDDIFVVSARGGSPRQITHDGLSTGPVWTTRGILVSHAVRQQRIPHHGLGASEIWLLDPDGGSRKSLSGPLPSRVLGSGISGLTPVAWEDGSLLAGLISESGSTPFAVDPDAKRIRLIGSLNFGAIADGLSHDGRKVLVEAGAAGGFREGRVIVLPFAGGSGRLIARSAGDASWNL